MTALVRAEWTKLFTTRVWLGLLLGSAALVAAFTAFTTAFAGDVQAPIPPVGTPQFDDIVLSQSANASILFLILGIIGMTQEYRHRTATPTFLTSPHRGQVVIAKLIAYALAAAAFAVVVVVVNFVVAAVYAGARGAAPALNGDNAPALNGDNLTTMASALVALVIYAVIGVGLGALLRNQVGAIVGGLVYLLLVESIIRSVPATAGFYKWLPGGGLEALTATLEGPDLLEAWQGGLLLLAYGLVAAFLGTVLAVRRDVV